MKIDPFQCRFMIVDPEMLSVMYPDGTWRKQLLAVYICTSPKRTLHDKKIAGAQGFPGPLCTAPVTGDCPLFEQVITPCERTG